MLQYAVTGIPLYLGTRNVLGKDISAILMIAVMTPLFLLAMYERDGKPAEKILSQMIRQRFLTPGIRRYKSENLFRNLEEKEKMEKEVKRLEEKKKT